MKSSEKADSAAGNYAHSRYHTILVITLVLVGMALIYRAVTVRIEQEAHQATMACVTETRTLEMKDSYLRGVISKGEAYEALLGYYTCNPPQVGDLVLYQGEGLPEPVVKVVRAIEGDQLGLIENPRLKRWQIKINEQFLVFRKRNYYFGRPHLPTPLKDDIERRSGELKEGELVIFSLIPPGIQDSGNFGVVLETDLLGKVLPADLDRLSAIL